METVEKGKGIEMEQNKETFEYTYSARQQEEIEKIRKKYLPPEEDKMTQLRRLDESATRPGLIASISLGVVGALVLGIGMCCVLVWAENLFGLGIVVGVIGLAMMGVAYPVYCRITRQQREKLAPQILALTEELRNG